MKFKSQLLQESWDHKGTRNWLEVVERYAKISNYKKALDIGTGGGNSALIVLLNGKGKVTTVDIKGQRGARRSIESYPEFAKRITFLTEGERPEGMYELIIVDGGHFFNEVLTDMHYAWAHLKDGGYMVCDDYERFPNDVGRAINTFVSDCEINFKIENGKAVLKK